MKRFSKIMMSVAAVSAVTAAMAVSASAMTASYEAGKVTLSDVADTGTSQTLLVLDQVDLAVVEATNIKQIDQKDDSTSFAEVTVGDLADGTYEVRIGGNGEIQKATFKVGEDDPNPPAGTTIVIGDVDGSGDLTGRDGVFLARKLAKFETNIGSAGETYKSTTDEVIVIGDVDGSGDLTGRDGVFLARKLAKFDTNIGNSGQTVEVIKE